MSSPMVNITWLQAQRRVDGASIAHQPTFTVNIVAKITVSVEIKIQYMGTIAMLLNARAIFH